MQMPVTKQVLAAMNIRSMPARRGHDVSARSAVCARRAGGPAILTGDRDSLQLVDEHVSVRLAHTQGGRRGRSATRRTSSARNTG